VADINAYAATMPAPSDRLRSLLSEYESIAKSPAVASPGLSSKERKVLRALEYVPAGAAVRR
jgi:hypothetical protein